MAGELPTNQDTGEEATADRRDEKKGTPGHCSIKAGQKKTGEKLYLAMRATSLSKGREIIMLVVRR